MHVNAIGTLLMWVLSNYISKPVSSPLQDVLLWTSDPCIFAGGSVIAVDHDQGDDAVSVSSSS
jgi:hypothetical protein